MCGWSTTHELVDDITALLWIFLLILFDSLQATEVLSQLYAAHHEGRKHVGVDIEVSRYTSSFTLRPVRTSGWTGVLRLRFYTLWFSDKRGIGLLISVYNTDLARVVGEKQ